MNLWHKSVQDSKLIFDYVLKCNRKMALLTNMWLLDISITLTTTFLLLYLYSSRHYYYWKKRGIPYVKPYPFFGNLADVFFLRKQMGPYIRDMYNKMQTPFFGIFFLDKPHLMLKDPELIKAVLIKDFNSFADRAIISDEAVDPVFANFLFSLKHPEWRIMRNKITPIFTSGKIKNMFELINEAGQDMADYLKDMCKFNEIVEIKEICGRFTTDITSSCGFGINANSFKDDDAEFRRHSKLLLGFSLKLTLPQMCYFFFPTFVKLFKMTFLPEKAMAFFRKVFWTAIYERERSKVIRHDFVDVVVNIRKNETLQETVKFEGDKVIGQAMQFFTAGTETTSFALTFILYELALHPKIQERVRKEIVNCVQTNEILTYEAISQMKYLDMVVSEGLRKYPILPFLDRMAMSAYRLPGTDLIIEKGVSVYVPVYGLHYDPKYYPEPDKFNPERFSEDNIKSIPACTYLPFGDGPRNCIGSRFVLVNLKVGIAHILREFELEACENTPPAIIFPTISFLLSAPLSGLNLRFKKI